MRSSRAKPPVSPPARGCGCAGWENMAIHAMAQRDYALADRLLGSIAREVGDRRPNEAEARPDNVEARPITEADRARVLAALVAQAEAGKAHAAANRVDAANRGGGCQPWRVAADREPDAVRILRRFRRARHERTPIPQSRCRPCPITHSRRFAACSGRRTRARSTSTLTGGWGGSARDHLIAQGIRVEPVVFSEPSVGRTRDGLLTFAQQARGAVVAVPGGARSDAGRGSRGRPTAGSRLSSPRRPGSSAATRS